MFQRNGRLAVESHISLSSSSPPALEGRERCQTSTRVPQTAGGERSPNPVRLLGVGTWLTARYVDVIPGNIYITSSQTLTRDGVSG